VGFIEQNRDRPFFLYYPTAAIHDPSTPGKARQGTSQAGAYGDYIQEFDWAVGQVLAALDRLQLADRTIVVVTSDNGAQDGRAKSFGHKCNGDLRGFKGTAWEGGHRVPFVVRWPGKVPAGSESAETICHVDLMATLCAALGLELPADAGPDSWNVLPAWLAEKTDRALREATVCTGNNSLVFSIRQGPWKLVVNADGKYPAAAPADAKDARGPIYQPQLFHLATDPAEQRNLAESKSRQVPGIKRAVGPVPGAKLHPPRLVRQGLARRRSPGRASLPNGLSFGQGVSNSCK
jgi:arylsulfatase A-like enzyme